MSRRRSSVATEPPRARALRKLREAGDRLLGGAHFSQDELAELWELKREGKVEVIERATSGLPGWRLVGNGTR